MKLTSKKKKQLTFWILQIATACILIFLFAKNIGTISNAFSDFLEIISPLLIGFMIALILNVPMRYLESKLWPKTKVKFLKKSRKLFAFLISALLILGIFTLVVCLVIPEIIAATKIIAQEAVKVLEKLQNSENIKIFGFSISSIFEDSDWDKMILNVQSWLKGKSGSIMGTAFATVTSLIGGIVNFFISLVFSIYIIFGKDKLKGQLFRIIHAWLPKKLGTNIIHVASVANTNFRNFISGQTLEALILGILCMLGMMILRIPYAPMVGALVGITALIPVVGAFIGAGVGAFMILTVSPVKALVFVIFLVILQQIEGNVIYPKVMGSKVNLPAIWILTAVTVGGSVGGVLGMFLSVPVTSTIYTIIREATFAKEKSKENHVTSEAEQIQDLTDNSAEESKTESE